MVRLRGEQGNFVKVSHEVSRPEYKANSAKGHKQDNSQGKDKGQSHDNGNGKGNGNGNDKGQKDNNH